MEGKVYMRVIEESENERRRLLEENITLFDNLVKTSEDNKELIEQNKRMLQEIKTLKKIIKDSDADKVKSMKRIQQYKEFLERTDK